MTLRNYEHVPSTATIGVGMIDPDNYYQTVKAHTKTQLDKLQESDEYIASKATLCVFFSFSLRTRFTAQYGGDY